MRLAIEQGSFRYSKKGPQILKDVNVAVGSGEILAILGPNGAGKTTLLRCMMGLLPWGQGRTVIDGKDIRRIPGRELWRMVSYVPQAKNVSAAYTIEEMVLLGRSSRIGRFGKPGTEDLEKTDEVLGRLHLDHLRKKRCSEISGGELQMVLIARALASDPQILILDEPESNLDFRNQLLVLDTMSALAAEGMACVFNTHYPAHALRRAGSAFMLSPGGQYLAGATRQVVTEENIDRVFGVRAVIGSIETDSNVYHDVLPIGINGDGRGKGAIRKSGGDEPALAGISIIAHDRSESEAINRILHMYGEYIIGRMGMPYPHRNVSIINLALDAPLFRIMELTDKLTLIPGVSVKTTYAREETVADRETKGKGEIE